MDFRKHKKENHSSDFLTVGSMGHASQIALGYSMKSKKNGLLLKKKLIYHRMLEYLKHTKVNTHWVNIILLMTKIL